MSDLETLIVTFQTQLSDVMETLVKTAMYEVTKLVEDGFVEEVKRRNREVEALRIRLQWAERKLSNQEGKEGGKTGSCDDSTQDDVQLSSDTPEQRTKEQPDGMSNQRDIYLGVKLRILSFYFSSLFFSDFKRPWCEKRESLCGKVDKKSTESWSGDGSGV